MEIPDVKVTDFFFVRKGLKKQFQILLVIDQGLFPHALFDGEIREKEVLSFSDFHSF